MKAARTIEEGEPITICKVPDIDISMYWHPVNGGDSDIIFVVATVIVINNIFLWAVVNGSIGVCS